MIAWIEEIVDEDDLLDEFDVFCSSIDVESSSLTDVEYVLHSIPVTPEGVVQAQEDKVKIVFSQEEQPLPNQLELKVAEHNNVVKADCLTPIPSRGCPIRYLAQQQNEFPPVIFTPEYEGKFYNKEQADLAQFQGFPVLKSFFIFSIWKMFHVAVVWLSFLLLLLVAQM
jgi:hypothetical protein